MYVNISVSMNPNNGQVTDHSGNAICPWITVWLWTLSMRYVDMYVNTEAPNPHNGQIINILKMWYADEFYREYGKSIPAVWYVREC